MLNIQAETLESAHLNFLIGSGLSTPFLTTLGTIENLLTEVETSNIGLPQKEIIECSLYRKYFEDVIAKNLEILRGEQASTAVLTEYIKFLRNLGMLLLKRKSTILRKEANIFTTNIDVFLEIAAERIGIECNDGFSGRFQPRFSLSNFNKSHFKRSAQFDNISELPTINLLKLHGSLTWEMNGQAEITFSKDLAHVEGVSTEGLNEVTVLIEANDTLATLTERTNGLGGSEVLTNFRAAYDELMIVNPTKAKFRNTLLNQTHYEMLRIFANELEKENTILVSLGFSFADEHIREITLRAANSNPTLLVYVVAYDSQSAEIIQGRFHEANLKHSNVRVIRPPSVADGENPVRYDFPTLNKLLFASAWSEEAPAAAAAALAQQE